MKTITAKTKHILNPVEIDASQAPALLEAGELSTVAGAPEVDNNPPI